MPARSIKEQVQHLPDDILPGISILKAVDEYNYLQISTESAVCA